MVYYSDPHLKQDNQKHLKMLKDCLQSEVKEGELQK